MPYQEYFRSSTEGLVVVDPRGQIVEVNPRAEQLFGYSQEEVVGQPVEILIPEPIHRAHRQYVRNYFASPRTRAMGRGTNLAARRKDGSEFPVEISLTYARGTSRGDLVVAVVTDISERLALENEARRAEALTSLGVMAAGIAHDLNNPLQVIRARAELLLDSSDKATASETREDLEAIHRQAERASAIIEQFLQLSRRPGRAFTPLDINEVVERTLLLIGEQLRKSGITLETQLDRAMPRVMGDSIGLERVFINLLTNARDAMPDGGGISIESELLKPDEGWLQVKVNDTGPGIPPDTLGKIFNLLYTTKSEGSGLGLWLSRRIVNEHSGRIEVQSKLGKGTTFTIKLPLA